MTGRDSKAPSAATVIELTNQLKATITGSKDGLMVVAEGISGLSQVVTQLKEADSPAESQAIGLAIASIARDLDTQLWLAIDKLDGGDPPQPCAN